MKKIGLLAIFVLVGITGLQSCEDMDDKAVPVNDFIWKGMNLYYLWKDNVQDLNDNRFANQGELNNYLSNFSSPESLFESLIYERQTIDRWSVIHPDFYVLENALQGTSKSNGVEYGLMYKPGSQTDIFGYVRYILPNSDASGKDIHRGTIFYAVNGTSLTTSNYRSLLNADTYTLNFADYNNGAITPNGQSVSLIKTQYSENPVYRTQVYEQGGNKIGYLMYNGFYSNYDNDLNNAFGELSGQGITDLVLDLRYNSGGYVQSATYLASMITGQFTNQIFAKQQWNSTLQGYYNSNNPEALEERFASALSNQSAINHLNLNRVYILTTQSTASASELVINCLKPYIDVIVIGDTTIGKNVGSITLYDSPDFSRRNRSGNHRYAMQPIVLKIVNKDGFGDYSQGIDPTPGLELREDLNDLGTIGDINEPLLSTAIGIITNQSRMRRSSPDTTHRNFKNSKNLKPFGEEMYLDEVPEGIEHLVKNLQ